MTDTAPVAGARPATVLLTGTTGYIGGRLLARLEHDRCHRVRCLTRRPEALAGRIAADTARATSRPRRRQAGVRRIVHLGGLGAGDGLSAHLASRQRWVILRSSRVPRIALGLLAPRHRHLAAARVESLRDETVVRTIAAREAFGVRPMPLDEAIGRAARENATRVG